MATEVQVDEAIVRDVKSANLLGSKRLYKLLINDTKLEIADSAPSTSSEEADYGKLKGLGTSACYLIFRLGVDEWIFITYMPEGSSGKEKMSYAASKASVRKSLGNNLFAHDLHATEPDELSYGAWKEKRAPTSIDDVLSPFEKERKAAVEAEERERTSRSGHKMVSSGYHVVKLAFTAEAKEALSALKAPTPPHNFVELRVEPEKKSTIELVKASTITSTALAASMEKAEPRFYFYASSPGQLAFIYLCPEASPVRLRMVYSTTKPNVLSVLKGLGLSLWRSVEWRDLEDVTLANLRSSGQKPISSSAGAYRSSGSTVPSWVKQRPLGGSASASSTRKVGAGAAHPVYSLMGAKGASTRKKVVLPPRGAYGGW